MLISRLFCLSTIYLTSSSPVSALKASTLFATSIKRAISTTIMSSLESSTTSITDTSSPSPPSSLESWRKMIEESIGRSRKVKGGNYIQLATIDQTIPSQLAPRVRTVVFRGFQEIPPDTSISSKNVLCSNLSCAVKIISDNRSNKVTESSTNDQAEIVYWFAKTNEQYRIRGSLSFVGGGGFRDDLNEGMKAIRKQQWGNLSDSAREQFYWNLPGLPYDENKVAKVVVAGRGEFRKVMEVPETFLVGFLVPEYVDYLRLTDNFRKVDKVVDGEWVCERVNP